MTNKSGSYNGRQAGRTPKCQNRNLKPGLHNDVTRIFTIPRWSVFGLCQGRQNTQQIWIGLWFQTFPIYFTILSSISFDFKASISQDNCVETVCIHLIGTGWGCKKIRQVFTILSFLPRPSRQFINVLSPSQFPGLINQAPYVAAPALSPRLHPVTR